FDSARCKLLPVGSAVRVKRPGDGVGRRPPLQAAQGWRTQEAPWRKKYARGAICQRGLPPGARIRFVDAGKFATYSDAHFQQENSPLLERVFHLSENKTTVRQELLGGMTTFMTMAYVVVVNPRILSEAGMPVEGVLFATCISSAIATL